jgi:hypothetical protein
MKNVDLFRLSIDKYLVLFDVFVELWIFFIFIFTKIEIKYNINFSQLNNKQSILFLQEYARVLSSPNDDDEDNSISILSPQLVDAIKHVWSDEGVKTCYRRRREYRLTDSAK